MPQLMDVADQVVDQNARSYGPGFAVTSIDDSERLDAADPTVGEPDLRRGTPSLIGRMLPENRP